MSKTYKKNNEDSWKFDKKKSVSLRKIKQNKRSVLFEEDNKQEKEASNGQKNY